MIADTFSDQVRVICAALNLNKEELVHVVGIGLTTVKRWQKGKTRALTLFKRFCSEKRLKFQEGGEI